MKKIWWSVLGLFLFFLFAERGALENIPLSHAAPESSSQEVYFLEKSAAPEESALSSDAEICRLGADLSALPPSAQSVFMKAFGSVPCPLMQTFAKLELISDSEMPRALAGKFTIKLRSDVPKKAEFFALLLHEFAHVIDLGGLQGTPEQGRSEFRDGNQPIFRDDPSVAFYQISWEDNVRWRKDTLPESFVSGYAAVDPFEDFAESFLLYRRHGLTFRTLAQENEQLQRKYSFFKDHIFSGEEFLTGNPDLEMSTRPWDVTKL